MFRLINYCNNQFRILFGFVLIFLFVNLSSPKLNAQGGVANPDNFQKMVDILPPPPNAAAMARYGGIEVSQNTGVPNITIPLFEIKGKYLSVPISLNYSSSGIKVDEIASRSGMGWVLKAGGVITRTVRGFADETHIRRFPWGPIGSNWQTYKFMKDVTDAWFYGGFDAEPDLFTFSFPGGGGSFVFDNLMNPVQETASNQKIIYDFNRTDWNFQIIDAEGTIYYFGGAGAIEKNKRLNNCAKNFDGYTTTAWYLKRIKHISGEEIIFNYTPINYTYDCGVSQTSEYISPLVEASGVLCSANINGCAGSQSQAIAKPTCINKTTVSGVLLESIVSAGTYQKANLNYSDRTDCDDKLISNITLTNMFDNSIVKSFTLNQQMISSLVGNNYQGETESGIAFTPYLISLSETAPGVVAKIHRFSYLDPSGRPRRLSYSQDHWGYFNGQHNSSLLPPPSGTDQQQVTWFSSCTANRNPDGQYASKGLLSKITYPTGGIDSLIYESNCYADPSGLKPVLHVINCSSTGNNTTTPNIKNSVFYIGPTQTAQLRIRVLNSDPSGFYDAMHDFGRVYITNSSGASVFDELFNPGTDNVRYVNLQGGSLNGSTSYNIYIISQRSNSITTQVELKYNSSTFSSGANNIVTGGMRIRSILTSNERNVPIVKRYYYGDLTSLNISSSTFSQSIEYYKTFKTRTVCPPPSSGFPPGKNYCTHISVTSSSLKGLYDYKSSPVSYSSVVESIGDNFEGGGTQTKFLALSDQRSQVLYGEDILNAPSSAFSNYGNGKVLEVLQFKKDTSGRFIPVKKSQMSYKLDSRGFKSVMGYTVNRKYDLGFLIPTEGADTTCFLNSSDPNNAICMGILYDNVECFDMVAYEFPSYWIYADTTKEFIYDQNGLNPLITTTINLYEDEIHQQLTKSQVINSKGEIIRTEYKYPDDYSGVYSIMADLNILNSVVDAKTFNGSLQTSEIKSNYYWDATAGNYLINSIEKSIGNSNGVPNNIESIGVITKYDSKGNICEFKGRDGVQNVIIWGYNYLYPVAKISGATYDAVVGNISGGVTAIQNLDGQPLLNVLSTIRQNLTNAQVVTYTYKHLVGVTSIVDQLNRPSKFEYDGLGRLINVYDQDGNVVKKNSYEFASSALNKFGVFGNELQSGSFICQNCNWGYVGAPVQYIVPAGTYFSIISVQDANQKAIADINLNGQAYANKYGYCETQTFCSMEGYKFVGCGCELGIKVCLSSTLNANGTSTVQYKYLWSDGTYSQIYSSTIATCTGEGYKLINCNCVLGIKVYTSSVRIKTSTGIVWQCTYHYHWADGADSQDYTETNTSSCSLSIQ